MSDHAATADEGIIGFSGFSLTDTLQPVAMLLGGVPVLTVLVMSAAHYVISGSF